MRTQPSLTVPASVLADVETYLAWVDSLSATVRGKPGGGARWFYSDSFAVYTRVTNWKMALPGVWTLCLANIDVKERFQGQGCFSYLLDQLLRGRGVSDVPAVYVELVLSRKLQQFLLRAGFEQVVDNAEHPSYYRYRTIEKMPQS